MPSLRPVFRSADEKAQKIFKAQQKEAAATKDKFRKLEEKASKIIQQLDFLQNDLKGMQTTFNIPTPQRTIRSEEGDLQQQQTPGASRQK